MFRFLAYGLPLVFLLLAIHGAWVDAAGFEPGPTVGGAAGESGVILRFGTVAPSTVLVAWTMEALALLALFLVVQGRLGAWWLEGLVAGGIAWVFRGPLLVLSVVLATGQSQDAWWRLGLTWLALYLAVGLTLGALADRQALREHSSRRAVIVGAPAARPAASPGPSAEPADAPATESAVASGHPLARAEELGVDRTDPPSATTRSESAAPYREPSRA